jgi:basic amino acid/polyamine antiporter, APA family
MGIWSRKSMHTLIEEAYGEGGPRLKRQLGIVGLTTFGVGCTIGAGIFSLTGQVAAHEAGPAVTLAFVMASVACFFAGLCYAEFSAIMPISGSARDGLLPAALGKIDENRSTPYVGTIVTGAVAAVIAGFVPLGLLGELISIGTLLAFAIVCAGILILRRIAPTAPRPFRTPWVPWIPLAGIVCCVLLMLSLPHDTWIRLIVWLGIGLLVYASYGHRHSKLRGLERMRA